MARLIDADALIENMEMLVTTMSVCSTTIEARAKGEMKRTCIADVANASTIDAIPVEWLKEHDGVNIIDSDGNIYARRRITVVEALSMWQHEQEAQDG